MPETLLFGFPGAELLAEAVADGDGRAAPRRGRKAAERWYRSPTLWIAVAMLVASIAGCIVTIVLALGQPEDALPGIGERLLSVPAAAAEPAP